MSLNAVGLGALASFVFFIASWLFCLIAGAGGQVTWAVDRFFPACWYVIATGGWPQIAPGELGKAWSWVFGCQLGVFFLLWSTFGVAICRILALRIARDEICSVGEAWTFAWRAKLTALLFPVALVLPILFLAVCNGVAGYICSIPYLGWIVGVVLIPLVIVSSVLIALAIGVGLVSLGLIPAIVAVERKGTFDAAGKATNCITARPLAMILYLSLIAVFVVYIVHGLLIDQKIIEQVRDLTLVPFMDTEYEKIAAGMTDATTGFANFMAWIHLGIFKIFHLLLWGLVISLTLGGFTSIFLILRQDVDGIDPADIARDPAEAPAAVPAQEAGGQPESGTPDTPE
jgi:hypothetical protein